MKKVLITIAVLCFIAAGKLAAQQPAATEKNKDSVSTATPQAARMEAAPASADRIEAEPKAQRYDTTGAQLPVGVPELKRTGPANKPR